VRTGEPNDKQSKPINELQSSRWETHDSKWHPVDDAKKRFKTSTGQTAKKRKCRSTVWEEQLNTQKKKNGPGVSWGR